MKHIFILSHFQKKQFILVNTNVMIVWTSIDLTRFRPQKLAEQW